MNKRLFERLVESMKQHGEIARGERAPSRQFQFDAISVKVRAPGAAQIADARTHPRRRRGDAE